LRGLPASIATASWSSVDGPKQRVSPPWQDATPGRQSFASGDPYGSAPLRLRRVCASNSLTKMRPDPVALPWPAVLTFGRAPKEEIQARLVAPGEASRVS
jgi:hypothetical protein